MLLTLASELIELILSFVQEESLLPCLLINKRMCEIMRTSPLLQYRWTLFRARMRDNPLFRQPFSVKMDNLLATENAWLSCNPKFETTADMPYNIDYDHCVSDGVLFVPDQDAEDGEGCICYLELPGGPDDVPEWKRMRGTEDIDNLAIGLCIAEHDLVALVNREKEDESQPGYDIVISLVQYSTGDAHPLAEESKIVAVSGRTSRVPTVDVEISGDHIVLVMTTDTVAEDEEPDDLVVIYDWRKGILKATIVDIYHQYMNVVFLTETLILLPMLHTQCLAIYRIPSEPRRDMISPILLLQFPLLSDDCDYEAVPAVPLALRSAFLPRAEDAICAFEIIIAYLPEEGQIDREPSCFTMIVHRKSFVEIAEGFDEDPSFDRTEPIAWENWGPFISRWLESSTENDLLILKCSGQRYVRKGEKDNNPGCPYVVLDFNDGIGAHSERSAEWEDVPRIRYHTNTSMTRVGPDDLFEGPVQGSLPYTASVSNIICASDSVLLDSEYGLGIYVR
ncbi:hypothetical protein CPC08DRAFT_697800 [Agrocybe pediades]|nr:hypothetical protein CPC08DRAFT_697800 [Agrocybe pediades]